MKHLKAALFGLVFGLAGFAAANVAPLPYFQGAMDPSQLQSYLNTLILALNNELTNYITFGNPNELGEMQVSSTFGFAGNGTTATTMTSLGPTGSHTTVQEWLVVFDKNGFARFIPAY